MRRGHAKDHRMNNTPESAKSSDCQVTGSYQLPSLDFLQSADSVGKPPESKAELAAKAQLIQQTLAQFDIEVSLGDITTGPTITRYELNPAPGVKLENIVALANNLAAALQAERIHLLAPIPGTSFVGIEVPNTIRTKVVLRELLESAEWRNTKARIPLALGKDVYGHTVVADLAELPHLLIGGSTGAGKSVCLNAIITSLLYRISPEQLRFVMIDPLPAELQQYKVLPHLIGPVVTSPKNALQVLHWVVREVEERAKIFAHVGVRNITSFNSRSAHNFLLSKTEAVKQHVAGFVTEVDTDIFASHAEALVIPKQLSYLVVVISELADLMLTSPAEVEMAIARITQMGRAVGIHCIIATQQPSVDVITGVIKSNIPARIAFQVASRVDSRTILDATGAEKLLGKGDMLYLPPGSANLKRAQGALITDKELEDILGFIAKQGKPSCEMDSQQQLSTPSAGEVIDSGIDEDEKIIQQCIEVIRDEQRASVSLIQRRLRLGYGRAERIMKELEGRGIVGESKDGEPRKILVAPFTFGTLVVGHSNNFAYAAATAVAVSPGEVYNPLFIYGGEGLGKTHLLHAISNNVSSIIKDARVAYFSAEQFAARFVEAVKNNRLTQFRETCHQLDLLLIDDVEYLAGKERLQEEFFHIFNALHEKRRQIVIACNCSPKEIPNLEQRLVSRFEWGMIADLQPPDNEMRRAILQRNPTYKFRL